MSGPRSSRQSSSTSSTRHAAAIIYNGTSKRPPAPPPRILLLVPICLALSFICILRYHSSIKAATAAAHPSLTDAVRTLLKRGHHQVTAPPVVEDDPYAHDVPCYIPYHILYAKLPPALGLALLLLWLMFLFSFLGIVASDFFCPNLSTLAARLGLPDDVAGATMVGWANGAPDVFSTFASIKAGSGSLAIGELIGAASFICSVVAGSMVLVKPFKVSKFNFFRDVGFFTIAVAFALNILRDGKINAWESRLMIALYFAYVVFVATGSFWRRRRWRQREKERLIREAWDERVPDVSTYQDAMETGPDAQPELEESSQRQQHHHEPHHRSSSDSQRHSRSRSLAPLVIPSLRLNSGDDYFSSPAPISGIQSPNYSPLLTPNGGGGPPGPSRRRSHTVTSASGRHTPTTPFPPNSRSHAHSASHARSTSHHHIHMQGRMSFLGALEFRDVVNSLQAESHANKSLAAFDGPPRSSSSSTASGGSYHHPGHRRTRSQRRRGSSSELEDNLAAPKRPAHNLRPLTFHGVHNHEEAIEDLRRKRAISRPVASPPTASHDAQFPGHRRDLLSADDMCLDDPWRGASTPQVSSSAPPFSTTGDLIPDWNARELTTSDEDRDGSTAGESDVTARPPAINVRNPTEPTGALAQFPTKALKLLGLQGNEESDATVPPKAQRLLGLADDAEVEGGSPLKRRMSVKEYFFVLGALAHALFPSLHHYWHKSFLSKITSIICTPAILLLNLTLPVVDESTVEEDLLEELEKEQMESDEITGEDESGDDSSDSDSNISIKDLRQRHHDIEEGHDGHVKHDAEAAEDEREDRERDLRRRIAIAQELHSPVASHHLPHSHSYRQAHSPSESRQNSDPEYGHSHHLATSDGHLAVPGSLDSALHVQDGFTAGPSMTVPSLPALEDDIDLHVGGSDFMLDDADLTRYLTALQCLLAPIFVITALFGDELEIWYLPAAAGVGIVLSAITLIFFKDIEHITRVLTLCVIGFFVAVVWILTIVNEVVGVLQTIGHIFRLSDAILGLTIFAVGNSLGDLVANVTVARMGYPLMALSACFGGPMLNILLGVGVSGTYMTAITHKPVSIKMNTTLFVSGISLLAVLVTTLISVPLNGYVMSRRWAYGIIAVYLVVMTANVVVEIIGEKEA